ncbi:Dabb family protein [Arthrobacter sp. JSM 101049]|uniref:Dabb family protein n=1 Tax=Arthrobacter sp. JSM 101049 TaxID=929097 RepID=UPI003564578C
MIEHYVLFAVADGRTMDLECALAEFSEAMTYNCPALVQISWGPNDNPSGRQRGFTHGCFAQIDDDGFDTYWHHPAHQRLLGQLDELCTERFAMDYRSGPVMAPAIAGTPRNRSTR